MIHCQTVNVRVQAHNVQYVYDSRLSIFNITTCLPFPTQGHTRHAKVMSESVSSVILLTFGMQTFDPAPLQLQTA